MMEQGNGYTSEGGDRTAHAERLLASRAARAYELEFLASCTLYTSAEPCAMCSGAIYWAGIGRVVYGQTEKALKAQTGAHEENPTLDLPCEIVFARRAAPDRNRRAAARGRGGPAAGRLLGGEGLGPCNFAGDEPIPIAQAPFSLFCNIRIARWASAPLETVLVQPTIKSARRGALAQSNGRWYYVRKIKQIWRYPHAKHTAGPAPVGFV